MVAGHHERGLSIGADVGVSLQLDGFAAPRASLLIPILAHELENPGKTVTPNRVTKKSNQEPERPDFIELCHTKDTRMTLADQLS